MKTRTFIVGLGLFIFWMAIEINASYPEDISPSIEAGIEWLVAQQKSDGSWGYGEEIGSTAFAVVKLEERAFENGQSPFDQEYEYSPNVIGGLNYLFNHADAYDDDTGICFGKGQHVNYNTGLVMMAIAAGRDPNRIVEVSSSIVNGWTYRQVLQANVDFFTIFQNTNGGWQYEPYDPTGFSDNSITGYVVLGLAYAQDPIYGFSCTISDSLKDKLNLWVELIQIDGGNSDGGSGYGGGDTSNLLRAGNLIFEMAFLGDTPDVLRMQRALDYLGRAWSDPDWSWEDIHSYPGWYGNPAWDGEEYLPISDWWKGLVERYQGWQGPNYQAMYCMMKGLKFAGIDSINVNGTQVNWYESFAARIIFGQNDDGSWDRDYWGNKILATEWALLTLEAIAPPGPFINVAIDIKPGSESNCINLGSAGVIPVAVLSSDTFDATQIDPATVSLAGASIKLVGKSDKILAHQEDVNGDGLLDLVCQVLTEGLLIEPGESTASFEAETFDGILVRGEDTVCIVPGD